MELSWLVEPEKLNVPLEYEEIALMVLWSKTTVFGESLGASGTGGGVGVVGGGVAGVVGGGVYGPVGPGFPSELPEHPEIKERPRREEVINFLLKRPKSHRTFSNPIAFLRIYSL